nr:MULTISPECIES: caspase family protein [Sinorhizobium/Ensifer group]
MIVIAVSKYKGAYPALPGTLTCAARLKRWAEAKDAGRNYEVLSLTDEGDLPVSRDRLENEISAFVTTRFIDRLVVWFGGHGLMRGRSQIWLLSGIHERNTDAVDVFAFTRALQKVNIGKFNRRLSAGQLSIISDCCLTTAKEVDGPYGTPVISRVGEYSSLNFDRFASTAPGASSFHISKDGNSTCLFTDCMLGALSGEVEEAIVRSDHRHSPAIVNHSLAQYLMKEIPDRAAVYGEYMEPDIATGLYPPDNVYLKLEPGLMPRTSASHRPPGEKRLDPGGVVAPEEGNEAQTPASDRIPPLWADDPDIAFRLDSAALHINSPSPFGVGEWVFPASKGDRQWQFVGNNPPSAVVSGKTLAILCDFEPDGFALDPFAGIIVRRSSPYVEIHVVQPRMNAVAILKDDHWTLVPIFHGTVAAMFTNLPRNVPLFDIANQRWDYMLCDALSTKTRALPRVADAPNLERGLYHSDDNPLPWINVAQLYALANEFANVTRLAQYMSEGSAGGLPFDIALLCATKLYWGFEDNQLVAYAHLPAATPQGFPGEWLLPVSWPAKAHVRLSGIAPITTIGWSFLRHERLLGADSPIVRFADRLSGAPSTGFNVSSTPDFLSAFGYRVFENTMADRAIDSDILQSRAGAAYQWSTHVQDHFDTWDQ